VAGELRGSDTVRVIGGEAKGRRLVAPAGSGTRPATDRLKEALFNILASRGIQVEGARVLDLYAGAGSLGIEALSRGATSAVFVDDDPAAVRAIRENLVRTGLAPRAEIVKADAVAALRRFAAGASEGGFGLVFVDPPYALPIACLRDLAEWLSADSLLKADAVVAFERGNAEPEFAGPPPLPHGYTVILERRYGQTTLFLAAKLGAKELGHRR
jgi:16S rRNA (guanine966-N2)-methyltransferase